MKNYKFKFTAGKKIQGPNVSEHCVSLLLAITRGYLINIMIKNILLGQQK